MLTFHPTSPNVLHLKASFNKVASYLMPELQNPPGTCRRGLSRHYPNELLMLLHLLLVSKGPGSACKVPYSRKIHDTIVFLDRNYKLNLHNLLQDVTSVSLVLNMWKSGDEYGNWFVCCCVQFIDSLNKRQNYILNFKHLKKDSQTGEYYASEILKITEAYDITYTIHSIVLDSARSNIKFGDVFAESVSKAAKNHPHSKTLEPLTVFKGKESLVRCSAHIIHNATPSFIHNFTSTIIEITGKEGWKYSTREELEKMNSLRVSRALTDQ